MSHHHRRAAAISAPDPYFQNTVLLLTGNGTNGGQNNTFLDSSSNNFTITRNGNTTQGSFSPFGWQWSNYFDGTGDYLSVANNAALQMGSSDFTIECWVWLNALSTTSGIYAKRSNNGYGDICVVLVNGNLTIAGSTSGTSWAFADKVVASGITAGKWYHIAVVRNGGSITGYVNGISSSSQAVSGSLYDSGQASTIGSSSAGASQFVNGYIANFRLTKSAVYTANFTPPTAPLTAITNTQLLTCQSNRFVDNSTNAFAITRNGDVRVTNFSPFPAGEYAASVEGGSGYFDGSGDYLSLADNTALQPGTGDFTYECWWYPTYFGPSYQAIITKGYGLQIFHNVISGTNYVTCALSSNNSGTYFVNTSFGTPILSAWNHIAVVRTGNNYYGYLNGARTTLGTSSSSPSTGTNLFAVGNYDAAIANYPIYGYISSARFLKGSAEYTASSIAPPSSPLTAITNTSLLLNFTNASILDSTGRNDIETVGNAQISTSVKKFGTGSMKFDGTGDYLVCNGSTTNLFAFGSGDFTIEFWLYLSSTSGPQIAYDGRPLSTQTTQPTIYIANGGSIRYYTGSADRITGSTLNASQWYHIALSRSGTSTKLFVDGTQSGSTYSDSTNYTNTAGRPVIGIDGFNMNANYLNGYIDDLRITKGVARYTANFTPPYRQLPTR